ncbi:hypothetical protein ACSVDE_14505 [Pseudalkalibacillus sp. Hm43]|uniref:hypothetical protein n=1 Tax=Pseudalkalibacillus sp. Hm43 TaxID=3450742 RepID=UPI003F42652A
MRSFILLSLIFCIALLSGCGQEPLKSRNLVEADLYMRNNITQMNWNEFQHLLSDDHKVTKEEFTHLKDLNSKKFKSQRTEVENKIYRFNPDEELIYMTEWKDQEDILYLEDIYYISK